MSKNGTLTVPEASRYTGKCINTIRRYIKKGVIHSSKNESNGIQVITVEKSELDKVFKMHWNPGESIIESNGIQENPGESSGIHNVITKDNLRDVIQEFFESKQSQLMRPMEEHAFYLVGELKNEVKHLHAEKETLRHENEILKEQIKALPGPTELENKNNMILLLQKEKEEALKEQEARLNAKIEQVLKQAEEEKKQIVEVWKKELEEAKKPWWKIW
jgi:predicted RNase H-like nuclease (RuvC/YqgF family)